MLLVLGCVWHLAATPSWAPAIDSILTNYGSIAVRPGELSSPATVDVVTFQVGIDMMSNIDQVRQRWSMNGYFRTWWKDPRLAFDEAHAKFIHLTNAQQKLVWQPTLYVEKSVGMTEVKPNDGLAESMTIYPDGSVFRSQQRELTLSCLVDLTLLPFDNQTCAFTLGLYYNAIEEVKLRWHPDRAAFDSWDTFCPSAWNPVDLRWQDVVTAYPSGNFSTPKAWITFTRENTPSLIKQYLVSAVMLVSLGYLGFFINPSATPARVALGIITILAVVTNWSSLQQTLPPGSSSNWLSDFLFSSMIFNFIGFFEQVMVNFGRAAHEFVLHERADEERQSRERSAKKTDGGSAHAPGALDVAGANTASVVAVDIVSGDGSDPSKTPSRTSSKGEEGLRISASGESHGKVWRRSCHVAAVSSELSSPSRLQKLKRQGTQTARELRQVIDPSGEGLTASKLAYAPVMIKRWIKLPVLIVFSYMRFLDVYFRFLFPAAYIPFMVIMFSKVDFKRWEELSALSKCAQIRSSGVGLPPAINATPAAADLAY